VPESYQKGSGYAEIKRAVESMLSKTDATYLDLRERILFGELKAGSPYSAQDMAAHYGLHINRARRLLVALKVGGYLTRSGASYVISTFSQSQVEEWRLSLGAIVEIGAIRLAQS
jgi:DNA-binding GntR family transcriptional regulator